ncbi:SbtR family transcriptional regulator [Streptomyces pseudogriseolus]|uniref:SbtR family transcriptional regulator n=1 Tax=Streptomyces pseudogriseolus TaxID=36817 RepID=UPI003FA26756
MRPAVVRVAAERSSTPSGVWCTSSARDLLAEPPPATATRRWMDLFGDWTATKNGMLDTLLAVIDAGEIAHARTRTELLTALTALLDAGRSAGDLRADITAEDVAAALIGVLTVAPGPRARPGPPVCWTC